ncbi:Envelope glycoprotein M [Caprine alphaherpesvirus 1]|uniref:Envelope glycoprotein M n=1 Tax=Caprine alphaherpesvirus 1 TaxID=39944 RepID=A0AAE6D0C4_9ALPH|nr:Envelope glycoprotein M [Caprine alphaherpesvirus 1]QBM10891.1 Envelope glycoprotein M [Caprine alphaherpesvirus 1]
MASAERLGAARWRLWLVQASAFAAPALLLLVTLVAAASPGAGLPCFYAAVVDYGPRNLFADGGAWAQRALGQTHPALFLETPTTAAFSAYTALVLLAVAAFDVAAAVIIRQESRGEPEPAHHMSALAALATPPGALLLGALAAWTLQAAVLLLSHKVMLLAAATYLAHAGFVAAFAGLFCTAGLPSGEYADAVRALRGASPRAHRLLGPGRAVLINLVCGAVALAVGTTPLMLGQLLAASLSLTLAQTVAVGVAVFCAAAVLFLALGELVLSRYAQVLPGPAFGTLVTASCIAVSAHDYFRQLRHAVSAQAPGLPVGVKLALAAVALLAVAMLVLRLVRACLYHRQKNSAFYGRVSAARQQAVRYIARARGVRRGRAAPAPADAGTALLDGGDATDDEDALYETEGRAAERSYALAYR